MTVEVDHFFWAAQKWSRFQTFASYPDQQNHRIINTRFRLQDLTSAGQIIVNFESTFKSETRRSIENTVGIGLCQNWGLTEWLTVNLH